MRPKEQPITYAAPGFYGSGGQTFSSGQGRFLRPRFRYSASVSMGFDDNTLQTPTDSTATTLVIPEQPEISRTVPVREQTGVQFIGGAFRPVFRTVQRKVVLQPFQPEQVITWTSPYSTRKDFPSRRASKLILTTAPLIPLHDTVLKMRATCEREKGPEGEYVPQLPISG
jgi:hypothetical protein